jgi:hypothetical protein
VKRFRRETIKERFEEKLFRDQRRTEQQ